jgi:ATP-dependent Lon protease
MKDPSRLRLAPEALRWRCDPDRLGFETTNDFSCRPHIIGQERALDAIRLGLEVKSQGYNIYISGLTGTGKSTAIQRILESMDLGTDTLSDICYIYNFKQPDEPVCLMLPAGGGPAFQKRIRDVQGTLHSYVPEAFKSDQFRQRQAKILEDVKRRKNKVTESFEKEVSENGFSLVEVDHGTYKAPEIAPMVAGEVVSMEALPKLLVQGKLGKGDYEKMQRSYPDLMEKLDDVLADARSLQAELDHRMADLEKTIIQPMLHFTFNEVREEFPGDKVSLFLDGLEEFVMGSLRLFGSDPDGGERGGLLPFEVNVIVDNTGRKQAPVVIERSPGYVNLFGTIERLVERPGEITTDHTAIRAGSLHRANGGYLVLNLNDVFEEPHVYVTLKRALKNYVHQIRGFDSLLLMPIAALKPEAIGLDIKVVLIGDAYSYQILYEYDEDFGRIFKIKAEFDSVMPNRQRNLTRYSHFIKNLCESEQLKPFHKSGVAAVVEEGVRRAGRRRKLSTRFSDIGDVVREANLWATRDRARSVRDRHVHKALEHSRRRVSLYEEKMQELFDDGTILMDIKGSRVGQLNGLAVFDVGDHAFGKPSRITAETSVGRTGIINIEREADMSGRLHNKGVLILEGYLRRMYAQDKPLTMAASVCFEQAYSGIDGDSASSTEVYALLSSISGVPLRQDIAVTGSVNQKGEVQPIGGVNEKIEGFFDVCGRVMIPALNKDDLMLRQDVVDAVKAGRFHIYAVKTIDDGIEVLTGMVAGRRSRSGRFTRDSVHDRVDSRLRKFHDQLRQSEDGSDDGKGGA